MTIGDTLTDPIVGQMLEARSLGELFHSWWRNRRHLRGHRLLLSVPGVPNQPLPRQLDLPGGASLRGLLAYDQVVYLDNRVVWRGLLPGGAQIRLDYSVAFDTQVVRYLALALQGSANAAVPKVEEALRHLCLHRINWDFSVYLEENGDRLTRAEVYGNRNFHENVRAVEIFKDLDEEHFLQTGHLRPRASTREIAGRVERTLHKLETRPAGLKAYYRQLHRLMYAVLLAICWIQLRVPRRPVKDKLLELFEFFHVDLKALMARELRYGATLFERGQREVFFGRVQRSRKSLLADLNNMAWDLLIARRLEQYMGVAAVKGRYYLPYLLTFDQALVALMDAYALRGALLLPDGQAVALPGDDLMPLFQRHGLRPSEVWPYLGPEARIRRRDAHAEGRPDLDAIIARLEAQLTALVGS